MSTVPYGDEFQYSLITDYSLEAQQLAAGHHWQPCACALLQIRQRRVFALFAFPELPSQSHVQIASQALEGECQVQLQIPGHNNLTGGDGGGIALQYAIHEEREFLDEIHSFHIPEHGRDVGDEHIPAQVPALPAGSAIQRMQEVLESGTRGLLNFPGLGDVFGSDSCCDVDWKVGRSDHAYLVRRRQISGCGFLQVRLDLATESK